MQRLVRFARYWDLVANSGRFANTLKAILADAPFENFMAFSDWLYAKTDATHRIALDRLAGLVGQWLQAQGISTETMTRLLANDYAGRFTEDAHGVRQAATVKQPDRKPPDSALPQRQARHLAASEQVE